MSTRINQSLPVSRDLKLLWAAVVFLNLGFGIYSASTANFATEIVKVNPLQIGLVEAIRELPGFLCVFVAALTMSIAEPVLASIALMMVAGGIGAYATVHGVPGLIVWSFVWSLGLHTWMPLSSSMTMNLADDKSKGKRLGQTVGMGGLGNLLGMLAVAGIGNGFRYSTWFIIAGILIAIASLIMMGLRRNVGYIDKPRMVYKRRYRLYYILTFLEGCRKQVFLTFAVYTLTKVYDTKLSIVAALMVINGIVSMFGAPVVGRLIDRIGERRIMLVSYSAVFFVFLGYARIHHAQALYICYCLDNLFYLSTTCLTTYIQKVADPEDLMPTLSMGVTTNHIAAVAVPLIGGYLWGRFSYPVMFYGGAVVVLISLFFARYVGVRKPAKVTV